MHLCFYMIFPLILVESSRITERFETALNKLTKTGVPVKGKIKRYRCIEEYVSVDEHGNPIEGSSEVSREFTTTTPPVEERKRPKMHGVKNIKTTKYAIPPYKMKMYSKKKKHKSFKTKQPPSTTITSTTTTTEIPTTTESVKDPDRLIEELYLNPTATNAPPVESTREPILRPHKRISLSDVEQPEFRYSPLRRPKWSRNDIEYEDEDGEYDSYIDYPKLRRERPSYRHRPRGMRKHLFPHEGSRNSNMNGYYGGDDFIVQPRLRNRPISPRIVLPIATEHSLRSNIHQTQPQVVLPVPIPAATTTIQTITVGNMEMANKDSCDKVVSISKIGGIIDVWTWARQPGSCEFIQTMIQNIEPRNIFTCQQIWHFIDSCKENHLL